MSFAASTDEISGTPLAKHDSTVYTITVTDANNATDTATLTTVVNVELGGETSYDSSAVAGLDRAFTSSTPAVKGGTSPVSTVSRLNCLLA